MSIIICYGDEPYFIANIKKKLTDPISMKDFNIFSFEEFGEAAYDSCTTYPVMEEKKVVLIDLDQLSQLDTSYWKKYLKNQSPFTDLFILARKVDSRTKFFKELGKKKLLRECAKLSDERKLVQEIASFIQKKGGQISEEAMKELVLRENYMENEAVNLISITQDIQSMICIDSSISLEMVRQYVKDQATENVFSLAKLILTGGAAALRKELSLISSDRAVPTLALLLREYRIAYKALYFSKKEINIRYLSFQSLSKEELIEGIRICTAAMEEIKKGSLDPKVALPLTAGKLLALRA